MEAALAHRERVREFLKRHRIGLVTLLFTDLVGSTQLKQSLGDREAVRLIQRHHSVLRDWLSCFPEAEEIETAGDSFFIIFTRPSDAVRFSIGLQRRLRVDAREEIGGLEDRIGIHVGEVFIEERPDLAKRKDLYGLQVDTCARVASLAQGSQILLTRFAFDAARTSLSGVVDDPAAGQVTWISHGHYQLKGVVDPLEVCEAGEAGIGRLSPPPDSEKATRHRQDELERRAGWRPAAGQKVPGSPWRLDRCLGEGGHGEVWSARHDDHGPWAAFKFTFRPEGLALLQRGWQTHQRLASHGPLPASVLRIEDSRTDDSPAYHRMELVPGGDLAGWLAKCGGGTSVALEIRLEIAAQVAEALVWSHQLGVLHQDLKPGNILLEREPASRGDVSIKLADFGVWELASPSNSTISTSALMLATPLYQSPEQCAGKGPLTPAADIYSLGVVLYELLTGRPPFVRPSISALMEAHQHEDPTFPSLLSPGLPESVQRICLKALEKLPQSRYASAAAFAADLRRAQRGEAVKVRPSQYDNFLATRVRRHLSELARWRQEGLVSDAEFAQMASAYQRFDRSGLEAVLESRRVHLWVLALLLGGWLVLDGSAIWLSIRWDALATPQKLLLGWVPVLLLNGLWAAFWKHGSYRGAHLMMLLGAIALPGALGVTFHTCHWLETNIGQPSLPVGQLFNLQMLVAAGMGLAWAAFLAWRTRTASISTVALAWLLVMHVVWLDRLNLTELFDGNLTRIAAHSLPVEVLVVGVGAALARIRSRQRQALPWFTAGLVLFLAVTLTLAYCLPPERWGKTEEHPQGLPENLVPLAQGVLFMACGLAYGFKAVFLRRWFLISGRLGYLSLFWAAPLAFLGGLTWIAARWPWPEIGFMLAGERILLPDAFLFVSSVACVGLAARLQIRFFAFCGLAFLTVAEWRIAALYFESGSSGWPRLLLFSGFALVLSLAAREIWHRRKHGEEDMDDIAELWRQRHGSRQGKPEPSDSDHAT